MIVNHVENHAHAQRVRTIDKGAQIIRRAIQVRWREKVHAIVPPAEFPREIRDWHHFDHRDPDTRQLCQLLGRGAPCSFTRECANVHFVHNLAFYFQTRPRSVHPLELHWIDNAGRAVRPIRLKA